VSAKPLKIAKVAGGYHVFLHDVPLVQGDLVFAHTELEGVPDSHEAWWNRARK